MVKVLSQRNYFDQREKWSYTSSESHLMENEMSFSFFFKVCFIRILRVIKIFSFPKMTSQSLLRLTFEKATLNFARTI